MQPKLKRWIENHEGKQYLKLRVFCTLEQKELTFDMQLPEGTEPFMCWTATTGMVEAIGNMTSPTEAVGYAFSNPQYKFTVKNPKGYKKGDRVIITEHLTLDQEDEYLVTQHNIGHGDINFVNLGYTRNGEHIIRLTVDLITGEHQWQAE
jgi:hypothetical protein